ncbi:MAG: PBP1A family penicillin-binding protein [Desulfobacterales bacterium]|nr:PBP1A family penicillin-binding protein [Desulfobacterales bacterium]
MNAKKPGSRPSAGRRPARKPGRLRRVIWFFVLLLLVLGLAGAAGLVAGYYHISADLPKINSLMDYRPPIITKVFSDDNRVIAEFFKERRIIVQLDQVPPLLIQAFVAAEDARFFQHQGFDPVGILRAALKNLEAGTIKQGGSTITQQVTRSFLLTPERSYIRKIKELILSYRIEKAFSKEEILFLYLNQIYLGHGAYGVEAAAQNYFGKSVGELSLAECAMLAGLPQAPSRYSPFRHPEQARQRQLYVLTRMVEEGIITAEQAAVARGFVLDIKPRRNIYIEEVPFYAEHVRRAIEVRYGTDALYTEGLQIFTAVNIDLQKAAEEEVLRGLVALDRRQGYRGPLKTLRPEEVEGFCRELQAELDKKPLAPGMVTRGVVVQVNDTARTADVRLGNGSGLIALADMEWARKPNPDVLYSAAKIRRPGDALKVGDVILVEVKEPRPDPKNPWRLALAQDPAVQGALLCMETETGRVRAMVGGRDFLETQFNRALQSRRQPGSAFKPLIYAAALDRTFKDPARRFTPASMIIDSAVVFEDRERDQAWKPKNYRETFYGPTLLREALAQSRNLVTVKLLQEIGVDHAIDYARRLGITSELTRTLSLALGASGVSLLELTRAYSVFANQGRLVEPVFITKVLDRDGQVLEEAAAEAAQVIGADTAYLMTSMLESVIQHGTGQRAKALNRPAAGKTGTTNDTYDAWFIGYTRDFISGAWVGFDEERPLGKNETGAAAALPIWLEFMKRAQGNLPVRVFEAPEGVVFARIDADTGLLPVPESRKTLFECFKEGTEPVEYSKRPGEVKEAEDFLKKDL